MDEHNMPPRCPIDIAHLEKMEDRIGQLERAVLLAGQKVDLMGDKVQHMGEKLYGSNGATGLVVDVDRLNHLNINERFTEQGKRIERLEVWYAKMVGAGILGSFLGGAVMRLWR